MTTATPTYEQAQKFVRTVEKWGRMDLTWEGYEQFFQQMYREMNEPLSPRQLTQLIVMAIGERQPEDLPGFDWDAVEEKHGDIPGVWVSHPLVELLFSYDPDNKPSAEQLKNLFVSQDQRVFDCRSSHQGHTDVFSRPWSEVRTDFKAWLAEPNLNDLTVTFED